MANVDVLVNRIESDGIVVITNGHSAVPLGTTFTAICKTRVDGTQPDLTTVELGFAAPAVLRLLEVTVFRKTFPEIPAGYSAGLRLEGSGLDTLQDILRNKRQREYVHLRVT